MENIKKIVSLHYVIQETLRFVGPGTSIFFREAQQDNTIGKYRVKKGTVVSVGAFENMHNPKFFSKPSKFDPSRWKDYEQKNKDPYEFLPFSAGSRNCIGQHFAQVEAKVTIIQFLRKFKAYNFPPGFNPRWTHGFVYETKEPLLVRVTK